MKKRVLSIIVALALILCVLPAIGLAESGIDRAVMPADAPVWDGSVANAFAGGSGSETDPYRISNGAELAYFAHIVNDAVFNTGGLYFALTADIYLNDISNVSSWNENNAPANIWTPIGYNTYEIVDDYNIRVKDDNAFKGLFDGRGHTIHGVYVKTLRNNDGFAPYQEGSGLFGSSHYASFLDLRLANSFIFSETSSVGGIVGWHYRGGLSMGVGYAVKNCLVEESVRVIGYQNVAGIVGFANCSHAPITECVNKGSILGNNGVGGIAGGAPQRTTDKLVIRSCMNEGSVTAEVNFSGDAYSAGGIVGWITGDVEMCANTGTITSKRIAGGIVGDTDEACFVTDCYNSGTVTSEYEAGGIVALVLPNNTLARCYNTGTVSAPDSAGALIGAAYNPSALSVSNCYYLNTSCPQADSVCGTPLTSAQLQNQASYVGFDFNAVWTMDGNESYPYAELRSIPQFESSPVLPGDVDGNGSVTIADAILALRRAMGLIALSPEQTEAADMDGNGSITIADAIMILRAAMGL